MFGSTDSERIIKISIFVGVIILGSLAWYVGVDKYKEYKDSEQEFKQKVNVLVEEKQDIEIINAYLGYKDGESKVVKLEGNTYLVTSQGEQTKVLLNDSKVTVIE